MPVSLYFFHSTGTDYSRHRVAVSSISCVCNKLQFAQNTEQLLESTSCSSELKSSLEMLLEFGIYCRIQNLMCYACCDTKQLNWTGLSLICIHDDFFERPTTASKTSHGHKNFKCQTVLSTLDQSLYVKNSKCRGREIFLFSFNYFNLSCHHEHLVK